MKLKGLFAGIILVLGFCSSTKPVKAPVDYVDTRIGTQAWTGKSTLSGPEEPMGFVYPGVGLPNAMVQLSPQTARTDRCYFSSQPRIQGFRASHYPNGAAMSEYGSFTLMPTIGGGIERVHERASLYSHDNETATPYYYSVMLEDYGIKAELTGVSKSGILRFTYPASEEANVVIDNARSEYENYFRVIPERNEIEGYITNAGRVGNQGYTGREFACYFVAKFSKAFDSYGIIPEPLFCDNRLHVEDGFKGEFYNNTDFSGAPVAVRTDSDVNFEWEASPAKGVNQDYFSVRYSGRFTAKKSGKHIFYLISDDYSRMFVDGKKVIDARKTHRPFSEMYSIELKEGESCDIVIEYAEKTKLATLRFACIEPESLSPEQLEKVALKGTTASSVRVSFATKEGEKVEVRVGTSFIDFNQARKNLESEIGSKSFEKIKKEGREAWEKSVGRIKVETSEDNKQIFYTAMQRIALTPRNLTEDGYHYSAFNGKVVPGIMYTDYSIWDTFRALHPLLVLLDPDQDAEMITGLLNSYDEGGWIPKWPSPGYSNIMHGTHGDAVIADAYVKGVRNYDLDKALEAMMKNATTPGTGIYKARVGIEDFIEKGFVPTDKYGESVERTMEFAYDDFCIAQVAKGMGRNDLYEDLMRRSKNYLNVLDPGTKLIRGRNSDGSWRPEFDQAVSVWAVGSDRDCENYYRNITFFAPHDVEGLIKFMGGPEELEKELDYFFENDFYYVGDEFSMHSPYLYNFVGKPWKTQKTIRTLVRDNFKSGLGGLPGNDDCGQLSAWYIFSAMGLYPFCPGTDVYQIGSPSFDKVTINLPNGKTFTVIANNNSEENVYIKSATLNGEPLNRFWISHKEILRGGTLIFEMSSEIVDNLRCDYIDTRVGTDANSLNKDGKFGGGTEVFGQTLPSVLEPNGMNFWTPQTRDTEKKGVAPYYYPDTLLQGFRNSHWIVGGCTQDYGSMTLFPATGIEKFLPSERAAAFSHDDETATPSYYSVKLKESGIFAEMTARSRSAIFRFSYPENSPAYIVVNPNSDEGQGFIELDTLRKEIRGYNPIHRIYQGWGQPAGYNGYFVIHFSSEIESFGTYSGDKLSPGSTSVGNEKNIGLYVQFRNTGSPVIVKAASSFTDFDGAMRNLDAEIPHEDFDRTRRELSSIWETHLGKIDANSTDFNLCRKFYGSFYRASFLPRTINDVDGRYPMFARGSTVLQDNYNHYDDFSMWDTYRALHPLLVLIDPHKSGEMMQSLVDKYKQGGWLPIFPCWNSYTAAMIGDHCIAAIGDAIVKGVENFDIGTAYEAMRKNAFESPENYQEYADGMGRRALKSYLKYGYVPLEDEVKEAFHSREQTSRTLEYAFDDYVLSEVALKLGKIDDYEILKARSQNYRNVIDPASGYANARHEDGTFLKDNDVDHYARFITEGAPCHYSWYVPHDPEGLMDAMGGRDKYIEKLDRLFEEKLYWHGNEPCHQVAYMYDYAGQPWKTQKYVRDILDKEYADLPGGLAGNDDAGQMSAWFIFSSLGFYPVCPGSGEYMIGSPQFDKAVLHLDGGKSFTIITEKTGTDNRYIQSMKLNGSPYEKNSISHSDIVRGGVLSFTMGDTPNE